MTDEEKTELAITLVERSAPIIPEFAKVIRESQAMTQSKLSRCLDFLNAISDFYDYGPDKTYLRDLYLVTGDHMVLTEEGWIPAASNTFQETGDDPMEVLDEVNKPER
jgi:hypothetical protein